MKNYLKEKRRGILAGAAVLAAINLYFGCLLYTSACKYIVFSFTAKCEDSLQPVADYVYKEWFPQSTSQLNDHARYDFAKYGEKADKDGKSRIEYWVPVL